MNLIIFGPPGSGKGTYSQRIAPKLNIVKISTGDIFRDNIKRETELGKKVKDLLAAGKLVPDDVTNEILKNRISESDAKKGFILDGYPRTDDQANFLLKISNIDAVINIIAPIEILIEKALARRVCSNTKCDGNFNIADIKKTIDGIDYELPPLLPKKEGICDKCGSKLIQRGDDNEKTINDRLKVYDDQIKPVETFLRKNTEIPFVDVYMNRPPDEVVENILSGLKKIGL